MPATSESTKMEKRRKEKMLKNINHANFHAKQSYNKENIK